MGSVPIICGGLRMSLPAVMVQPGIAAIDDIPEEARPGLMHLGHYFVVHGYGSFANNDAGPRFRQDGETPDVDFITHDAVVGPDLTAEAHPIATQGAPGPQAAPPGAIETQ